MRLAEGGDKAVGPARRGKERVVHALRRGQQRIPGVGKFIAISQHELSSARARDAKPILDAITSLNRFYLVLGRDSTKRPSAKVNQIVAVRAVDSGDSGDEDHEAVIVPQALAVRAAPAAGGKEGE